MTFISSTPGKIKKGRVAWRLIILPKTAAAPGSSKSLEAIAGCPRDVVFARQASLLYRRQGRSWDLVCSSKRGKSSGEALLNGDLKPGSRERLCSWRSYHTVKLYVGNISFTITEADLQHTFEQFGSVTEIKVVTDREKASHEVSPS
jgi:hypothetical protein